MKYNSLKVASCLPDYLGFIFFEKSPRNFTGVIPVLPASIQKVAVFVDAPLLEVLNIIRIHAIGIIQLHGDESPSYCKKLREVAGPSTLELWKVFSVGETFDYKQLEAYEGVVDKFLFDTSGAEKGGNGITFNWNLLKKYPSNKPFILSGGIGLEEMHAVQKIAASDLPLYAIDVNSKFENAPGLKNIDRLQELMKQL